MTIGHEIFKLDQGIIKTNLLTKFHEDQTRNLPTRVFTRKTAPTTGCHVFQWTETTFELNQHIMKTNILTNFEYDRGIIGTKLLTKFYDDRTRNVASRVKTAPPTGRHVFQRNRTTFELNQHIINTNMLTNFELDRGIIGTKLLIKFHEDQTRNVASRVFTNKCGWTDRRRTKTDHKSSPEQSDNKCARTNIHQYYQLTIILNIVIRIQRSPVDNGHFGHFP
ncbi:hypothetical protein DPMN_048717 [Dreissena polymorpha]|uniref:Uncharacterized protein n=1 Tax=Dreissena polymorpha TaxID=45954 RepID=A0A9D4DC31_DREPO|nr:hypothetical protein DPMN_048717 [Dreissena polymorpha]